MKEFHGKEWGKDNPSKWDRVEASPRRKEMAKKILKAAPDIPLDKMVEQFLSDPPHLHNMADPYTGINRYEDSLHNAWAKVTPGNQLRFVSKKLEKQYEAVHSLILEYFWDTESRSNPTKDDFIGSSFDEFRKEGTAGTWLAYSATQGAHDVEERRELAQRLKEEYKDWERRGKRGHPPFGRSAERALDLYKKAVFYLNITKRRKNGEIIQPYAQQEIYELLNTGDSLYPPSGGEMDDGKYAEVCKDTGLYKFQIFFAVEETPFYQEAKQDDFLDDGPGGVFKNNFWNMATVKRGSKKEIAQMIEDDYLDDSSYSLRKIENIDVYPDQGYGDAIIYIGKRR